MGWVVNATPWPFYPWKWPGTHCIWGWVGPRAGLDGCGKSRHAPGFNPRTFRTVATRYTDWALRSILITNENKNRKHMHYKLLSSPLILFLGLKTFPELHLQLKVQFCKLQYVNNNKCQYFTKQGTVFWLWLYVKSKLGVLWRHVGRSDVLAACCAWILCHSAMSWLQHTICLRGNVVYSAD
jgi:hypothetical protein